MSPLPVRYLRRGTSPTEKQLLDHLKANRQDAFTTEELAAATGLHPLTAHKRLRALAERGLVERKRHGKPFYYYLPRGGGQR